MVCTAHRLQCNTPHFPRHEFPIHATQKCSKTAAINCIECTSQSVCMCVCIIIFVGTCMYFMCDAFCAFVCGSYVCVA